MTERDDPGAIRLRRLRMRSWRRGMKEMDLILGPFADGPLADLSEDELAVYEALLSENDQDLYLWVTRRVTGTPHPDLGPPHLSALLDRIAADAGQRHSDAGAS
ncbi:succinate dehydrogenase assembly factor 2 [Paracoccus stylophorae]|uniref:FAD assembly factor SdhE n=1 Tax=Paracoccus stylophorae TaxID=659350 RepID=A0ABY7SSH7_9RHOB|nr:succinate dehydrogenase assembly factor 2 [Paracoccus stylophorae]WCR09974.1 succinate dehydrogenase assembly factor 2 [Paracoccus stylophorae]